ncbi:cytosolic protein [Jeotgalibacillus proteolyticus]|uniref:Cytosolic protein n=1 Tax=Jeotgalibacillus proteolyticus TaxID=2082395 RepID=A0A2S5GFB4_9BACL|nr:cytosolic protein [Jeotgalibacillus proteolyticus]PPA71605.1 cytosolic protein [Jeotgalibacillus proteolyticus]
MAGVKGIFKRFSSECETADKHREEELQTHYFKTSLDKVFSEVKRYYSSSEYTITSESPEHGEIMIQKKSSPKMFIIATIVSVRPLHTAVDIKASTEQTVIGGAYPKLKQEILSCYKALGQQMRRADS